MRRGLFYSLTFFLENCLLCFRRSVGPLPPLLQLTMRQVQPDHDRDVGLCGEELVLGEPEDEALEDFVGHRDAGLPQDQPQVEARRLGAGAVAASVHVFHEGSLKQIK